MSLKVLIWLTHIYTCVYHYTHEHTTHTALHLFFQESYILY